MGARSVHSQPGLGSTFWFEPPLSGVAGGEPASVGVGRGAGRRSGAAGPRLAGMQVLVKDDSAMNRDLVQRALALEGACATRRRTGQQAIELLRGRPQASDAVLMTCRCRCLTAFATCRIRDEFRPPPRRP